MKQPPLFDQPITLNKLESHLWEAANILRGSPVDRTDWKSYILPLLFFKRICDVWDEEYQEACRDRMPRPAVDFEESCDPATWRTQGGKVGHKVGANGGCRDRTQ